MFVTPVCCNVSKKSKQRKYAHFDAAFRESYSSAARGESEDAFGRQSFGMAPLAFPLCASRVTPGVFHTQGGLAVDDHGQVLRSDGDFVSGLFAVGGVAAGISGQSGGRGYSSGNGLLAAAGLGRLAGIAASQTA